MFVIALVICIGIVSGITYFYIGLKNKYRIVERISMNSAGVVKSIYIVQRLHSFFGFEWWTQADVGGEWNCGSVYDTKKEADMYIKSQIFNSNNYTKIHEH